MSLEKETITLAFKFKEGIMVGVDSRITDCEQKRILSDTKMKFFELSSNIFCTMSGRVSVLDNMFLDVQQKIKNEERLGNAPTTVYYASERVKDHLEEYGENNNDNTLTFGTIIGGRDIAGFGLYEATLRGNVARKAVCNYTALGSGSPACWRRMDSISADVYDNMSIMEAAELALKLLFYATTTDKFCGGTLRVFHLGINGPPQERSIDPFVVYSIKYRDYNLHNLERNTLFLLYPTSHPPIFADDLLALWKQEGIVAAHLVKEKRDFHVHRIVLASEEMASKVYDDCKKKAEPEASSNLSPLLQEFVAFELKTKSSCVRAWVQMCSEECLEIISQLPEGPQINDSLLPRIITLPPIPKSEQSLQLDIKMS